MYYQLKQVILRVYFQIRKVLKMEKNKEYTLKQIEANLQTLNNQILPKTNEIQKHVKQFHQAESKEFQEIIKSVEEIEDQMREKQEQFQLYINEIKSKRKDNEKLGQISLGVLEAKSEEIKSKVKNIDAVSTGIKQTVSKIKPEKLIKLPVSSQKNLNQLFTVIYKTIYADDSEEFDWKNFKKLALKHENGEDFIFRLVNINFKELSQDKIDNLLKLKADPAFQHTSVNTTYSYDIIDLADWVDYVCLGHQFNVEKKRAEKQYDKIRKDIDKRSGSSLQMSENFWKEANNQIQKYQVELQSINSEFKTMIFGLKKSVDDCEQLETKTQERIEKLRTEIQTNSL